MTQLTSSAFWRDILARAMRNGVQVLLPVLILASTGKIDGLTVANAAAAAALSAFAVIAKTLAGFTANPGDSLTWQIAERAIGAAFGAVVALLPLTLSDALQLDLRTAVVSVLGSVLAAFGAWITNPPVAQDPTLP